MQTLQHSFPGISLLLRLNADRLYALGMVMFGLAAGAMLGSSLMGGF